PNQYDAAACNLCEARIQKLREAVTAQWMRVEIVQQQPEEEQQNLPYMEAHKVDPATGEDEFSYADATLAPALVGNGNGTSQERNPKDPTTWGKVGRDEMCPCGSGKKYKHCHGRFG